MSKHNNTPSLMEVGPPPPPVLEVGGSSRRRLLPTFATPFSQEIMDVPRPKKVKMPSVEPFDGTTDFYDHLDVYKAQMYIQDVEDAIFCPYFPTTLRGIVQKWFNGILSGSITSFLQLAELFSTHLKWCTNISGPFLKAIRELKFTSN